MTKTQNLPKTQAAALDKIHAAMPATGEIGNLAARALGAGDAALSGLVARGVLVMHMGTVTMTEGPYAGETIPERYYSVAE